MVYGILEFWIDRLSRKSTDGRDNEIYINGVFLYIVGVVEIYTERIA